MQADFPRDARDLPRDARDMVARSRAFLDRKGIAEARLDAELLVAHALGLDRLHLFLELDRPVVEEEVARARDLLVRRGKGEPTAYLVGEREFYGRPFRVGPGVLVPRPESELLVDLARERGEAAPPDRILDVGTGSGCLAISLALAFPAAEVDAVDISEAALAFALDNARLHGVEERVHLHVGDGLAAVPSATRYGLAVSNPPYVDPADEALDPGVRAFEPAEALFAPAGHPDYWVERLRSEVVPRLVPGGSLLIELGYDQAARLAAWKDEPGFRVWPDLAGIERVLEITTPARAT